MYLKILLPYTVFSEQADVVRIVVETHDGSFGLLPHRRDCVAALAPGILMVATAAGGETWVAVDEGVLVKTGADVTVSVRRALAGVDLGQLRQQVEHAFLTLDTAAQSARIAMEKLDASFTHHLTAFQHG